MVNLKKILPKYCRSSWSNSQIFIVKQNFTHLNDIAAIQVETDENTDYCGLAPGEKTPHGRLQPGHGPVPGLAAQVHW